MKWFYRQGQNERKRLIKSNKQATTPDKVYRIKLLNREIKKHVHKVKTAKVRRSIYPGNTASLWSAVKIAKVK